MVALTLGGYPVEEEEGTADHVEGDAEEGPHHPLMAGVGQLHRQLHQQGRRGVLEGHAAGQRSVHLTWGASRLITVKCQRGYNKDKTVEKFQMNDGNNGSETGTVTLSLLASSFLQIVYMPLVPGALKHSSLFNVT